MTVVDAAGVARGSTGNDLFPHAFDHLPRYLRTLTNRIATPSLSPVTTPQRSDLARCETPTNPEIFGATALGFDPVREAFASNLRTGDDLGAAVAVYRRGELRVDLLGGSVADEAPYPPDLLHVVHSGADA
jgi:CubicO group peptidase (beta-lactamase class C family)